jgi:hypothetical protein
MLNTSCRNNIHVYTIFLKEINYVQHFTNLNYVQEINKFKVQRIGFREYDTTDAPCTSDDSIEEEFEKLTIYW